MDDIQKQQGTSFRLHQTLCIIAKPSIISNWNYIPETLNSDQNWRFLGGVTLECDR